MTAQSELYKSAAPSWYSPAPPILVQTGPAPPSWCRPAPPSCHDLPRPPSWYSPAPPILVQPRPAPPSWYSPTPPILTGPSSSAVGQSQGTPLKPLSSGE
ncbi:unnamed protein product [Arctogadus glacialis]